MSGSASAARKAVVLTILLGLFAVGTWAFGLQVRHGEIVTGLGTVGAGGVAWGLYIVMDGYFLGAGVAVMAGACIARFSRDRDMEALARIAMPVAITCFLGSGLSVMADQGRPLLALWNLSRYARPQSPLFATFTTVGAICLYGSLVHCVLARRADLAEYAKRRSLLQPLQRLLAAGYAGTKDELLRRQKVGFWMSLAMLPALLVPLTALASIFAVRPFRPPLLTLLEVVAFFLLSGTGGVGLLAIAAALVGRGYGAQAGLAQGAFARLGRVLLVCTSLSLVAVVLAMIASSGSAEPAVAAYAQAVLGEPYGTLFWTMVGTLTGAAWLLLLTSRRAPSVRVIVVAAILVQVGLLLHRYLLLVASQTHAHALPYEPGVYRPTAVELAVAVGIVATCLLLLWPAIRLIPFVPLARPVTVTGKADPDGRRRVATVIWIAAGVALAVAGFVLSLRVGADAGADPLLTGSPVLFVAGLAWLATSGAIYELLPGRRAG